ncbi:ABC transporter permease [Paenibacillus turpanensis]|uniref:ABC transporter permease n=1 Tax=Paenibacillus turpanensis TaxID=2689078 RepID=UPI0014073E3E|nr:ABC transporter permease [Paenibacillus turpanensis]
MVNLLLAELLKLKRSKMMLISMIGSAVAPFMVVVASYIHMTTKQPAKPVVFEQLFFETNLYTLLVIGVPLYGVVTAYLINREFIEDTLKSLLTIPVSRFMFLASKLVLLLGWMLLLTLLAWSLTLGLGALLGFDGLSSALVAGSFRRFVIGGLLLFALSTPTVLICLWMKSYVPTIIFTIVITMINVMMANSEHRGLFPWSAVRDIVDGTLPVEHPPEFSYAVIAATSVVGLIASLVYFKRTDIH